MNSHTVFVYGTLRKHERNHYLLKDAALFAEQAWTYGSLFDTGEGYPAIKESTAEIVYGEIFMVSDEQLKLLDQLEDYVEGSKNNLYDRKKQTICYDAGQMEAYVYMIESQHENMLRTKIDHGDWKRYIFEALQKPFMYFAYGSCMDEERFKSAKVDHYFKNVKGCGVLSGYTLRFTRKAEDGGRADLVEEGGMVEGKVYELLLESLRYLYKREGVQAGIYRPAFVDIQINQHYLQNVLTFLVVNKEQETMPPSHYVEEMLRGGTGTLSPSYLLGLNNKIQALS